MTAVAHGGRVLLAVGGRLRVWRPKGDGSGFDELHDLGGFDALCQVVVLDGRVYAVSGIRTETTDVRGRTRTQRRPALAAWDLASGDLVAKLPLPMTPRSLVAADGKLYLVESDNTAPGNGKGLYREKGRVSLIRPTKDGMETVGAFQPAVGTKEIYTCPVVAAGRLFHRHGTLLAVYDLRRAAPRK
jgi:hypothetical protein